MQEKRCAYWNEYHAPNGWICFCDLVAYGWEVSDEDLKRAGCSAEKRRACQLDMERAVGMGLVPTAWRENLVAMMPQPGRQAKMGAVQAKVQVGVIQ
ncbi:MAG: hypothetical protein H5U02_08820 [Clostridia bacterium]|nr:hypothetical protein [Clostridia bacterium]